MCQGSGGTTDICAAEIEYCGNGVFDANVGEQCDQSNGAGNCTSCICDPGYTPNNSGQCVVDTECVDTSWDIWALVWNNIWEWGGMMYQDSTIEVEFSATSYLLRATANNWEIEFDRISDNPTWVVNIALEVRADLSEYDTNDDIDFSYWYDSNFSHNPIIYNYPTDWLWIRWSESDPWIFVHNTWLSNGSSIIPINEELASVGQYPTETFELHLTKERFLQTGRYYKVIDPVLSVTCWMYCETTPPTGSSLECNDWPDATSANQESVLVSSCSAGNQCDWYCAPGYYKSGDSCVINPPLCYWEDLLSNPWGDSFFWTSKKGLATGDFDWNWSKDFVMARSAWTDSLQLYTNTPSGWSHEVLPWSDAITWNIKSIEETDINNDWIYDILVTQNGNNQDYIIISNGNGAFYYEAFGAATETIDLAVGNLNMWSNYNQIYIQKKVGNDELFAWAPSNTWILYSLPQTVTWPKPSWNWNWWVDIADFDWDGDADIYTIYYEIGNSWSTGREILRDQNVIFNGWNIWSLFTLGWNDTFPLSHSIEAWDINWDWVSDLIIHAREYWVDSRIYINNWAWTYTEFAVISPNMNQGHTWPILKDLDRNWTIDQVHLILDNGQHTIQIVRRLASWETQVDTIDLWSEYTNSNYDIALAAADFNDDGLDDIVVTSKFWQNRIILSWACNELNCGTADGKSYYSANELAPDVYSGRWEYCSDWNSVSPIFSNWNRSWSCGDNSCLAFNATCGNWDLDNAEICDWWTDCQSDCTCPAWYILDWLNGCIEEVDEEDCVTSDPLCLETATPAEIYLVMDLSDSMSVWVDNIVWQLAGLKTAWWKISTWYPLNSPWVETGGVLTEWFKIWYVWFDSEGKDIVIPSTSDVPTLASSFIWLWTTSSSSYQTNLWHGLELAKDNLAAWHTWNKQIVVVLGNGAPNWYENWSSASEFALQQADELKANGVEVYTLAYDAYPKLESIYSAISSWPWYNFSSSELELWWIFNELMWAATWCPYSVDNCPDTCAELTYDWHKEANWDFVFENIYCEGNWTEFEFVVDWTTGIDISSMPGWSSWVNGANNFEASSSWISYNSFDSLITVECLVWTTWNMSTNNSNQHCSKFVWEWCGDRIVQAWEECDDWNKNDNDSCTNDCQNNVCGDGIIDEAWTEECDWQVGCASDCTWVEETCWVISVGTGTVGVPLEFTVISDFTWVIFSPVDMGDGKQQIIAPTFYHTYDAPGTYLLNTHVVNESFVGDSSMWINCPYEVTVATTSCGDWNMIRLLQIS